MSVGTTDITTKSSEVYGYYGFYGRGKLVYGCESVKFFVVRPLTRERVA